MSASAGEFAGTRPASAVSPGAVLATLPWAVVVLDGDNRFTFANLAAEEIFATDQRRLRTGSLADFLTVGCPLISAVAEVRRSRRALVLHDVGLESPRLAVLSVDATIAPLDGGRGSVLLSLARRQARDGERPSSELAGMAKILAHEVKNPLSGIRGAAELLQGVLAGEERELATLICTEVDRIGALVDRVALLADEAAVKGAVNVHEVLRCVRLLAEQGFASRVRFREVYDPSLPLVAGNRDQLIQVFLNLVKNAAEALEGKGEIVLRSRCRSEVWRRNKDGRRHLPVMVAVRDTGPGIPDAERASLFTPGISKKRGGRGLGLALVAKIIDEHGGLIEVASDPNGTEFRIYLPVASNAGSDNE